MKNKYHFKYHVRCKEVFGKFVFSITQGENVLYENIYPSFTGWQPIEGEFYAENIKGLSVHVLSGYPVFPEIGADHILKKAG